MRPIFPLTVIALLPMLAGCAVVHASKHRGVNMEQVAECRTRADFLKLRDVTIVSTATQPDGDLFETYKVLMEQGSTGRAVMHGLLDVATLGVWEVAGTPIEGAAHKDKYMIVSVLYGKDMTAKSVTLGDPNPAPPIPAGPDVKGQANQMGSGS